MMLKGSIVLAVRLRRFGHKAADITLGFVIELLSEGGRRTKDESQPEHGVGGNGFQVVVELGGHAAKLPKAMPGNARDIVMLHMQTGVERERIHESVIVRCRRLIVPRAMEVRNAQHNSKHRRMHETGHERFGQHEV